MRKRPISDLVTRTRLETGFSDPLLKHRYSLKIDNGKEVDFQIKVKRVHEYQQQMLVVLIGSVFLIQLRV